MLIYIHDNYKLNKAWRAKNTSLEKCNCKFVKNYFFAAVFAMKISWNLSSNLRKQPKSYFT